ncbi:MAG: glycoside hydrolase [Dyadobacter sp. 50-39]|uniref:C40 family peptidase n=1 Tax=Dyadobacter sp. 50-39 TaxID=1895756 RepID=UPI0009610346|nr:C40 family peptidase [Dyadobacter sp. 50-39]OJV21265.1 MAG: glycoside hydrolase [Dyadobacter sp. 50-39]
MHFPIRLFVLIILFFAANTLSNPSYAKAPGPPTAAADSLNPIQSLVNFATQHLNIPYRSGGSSKRGFDCSGFVRYCFNHWNITLPHSSAAQAQHGEAVELGDAKPGDLIFFKGNSTRSQRIGHVGIITEVAPGYVKFIHSAWKGGIRYDMLNAAYYSKRFVAIKRMID